MVRPVVNYLGNRNSLTNDTKIYWQYKRQKGWLKPWKITMVADDKTGLSRDEMERVLRHCRSYQCLTVEIAIDFSSSTGVSIPVGGQCFAADFSGDKKTDVVCSNDQN
jgi:hypothetical protein